MTSFVRPLSAYSSYKDSRSELTWDEKLDKLHKTATLYVGNLSFYTTEEQVFELFSRIGDVKRVILGLDAKQKTPCGFAFVEYYVPWDAVKCLRYISGTKLDERVFRADLDTGYTEGRQYGRGKSGGQVRDEFREDYDAGRGGWGRGQHAIYQMDHEGGASRDVAAGDWGGPGEVDERPEGPVEEAMDERPE